MDEGRQALMESLHRLYESGDFSDFTIKCGTDKYKVHKSVLCPRPQYFDAMFKIGMKENNASEVDLSESDPVAVKSMIHYFYHLDYPDVNTGSSVLGTDHHYIDPDDQPEENEFVEYHSLLQHCRVYALADMCQVEDLKKISASKFKDQAEEFWYYPDWSTAIKEIWTNTVPHRSKDLRDTVLETLRQHKTLLDFDDIRDSVKESDLAFEILMVVQKDGWAD